MNIFELYAHLKQIPQSGDRLQFPCGAVKKVEIVEHRHLDISGAPWCDADLSHATLFRGARVLGAINLKGNN